MISLANSAKYLKKDNNNSTQYLPENRIQEVFPNSLMRPTLPLKKHRHRYHQKEIIDNSYLWT